MPTFNDTHYAETFAIPTVKVRGEALNSEAFMKTFQANFEIALNSMAEAILSRARMTVPFKHGDLSDSGRIDGKGLEREVIFGSMSVPYASYQERGERLDGSYKVRNYTTPGTGKRFLQNAFESVIKEGVGRFLQI